MSMHIPACIHFYTCMYTNVDNHAYAHIHTHFHTCVSMHVSTRMPIHMIIHASMHVCVQDCQCASHGRVNLDNGLSDVLSIRTTDDTAGATSSSTADTSGALPASRPRRKAATDGRTRNPSVEAPFENEPPRAATSESSPSQSSSKKLGIARRHGVVREYVLDSGADEHAQPQNQLNESEVELAVDMFETVKVGTGNGEVPVTHEIQFELQDIVAISAYVMHTYGTNILSMGKFVLEQGY